MTPIWLLMVLHGGKLDFNLVSRTSEVGKLHSFDEVNCWRLVTRNLGYCTYMFAIRCLDNLVRIDHRPQVYQLLLDCFYRSGSRVWFFLSRINALQIPYLSTLNIDGNCWVEEVLTHFRNNGLAS
ncbi:hypothetical protein Tco_1335553 [Tanacetum coccineum]